MTQARPTLSVVIPNYDDADRLPAALDSVLEQSVPADEVLVIDDGSRDSSLEVLEAYASQHPRLRVHANGENLGVVATLNRGVAEARGDFVFTLAADHRLRPGMFERSLDLLASHPDAGLCLTDFAFLGAHERRSFPKRNRLAARPGYCAPGELERALPASSYILPAYGGLFRRKPLVEAGGFLPELRWHSDWFATLVLAFRSGCCVVPEPLVEVRIGSGSYSSGARVRSEQARVLGALLERLDSEELADVRGAFLRSGALAYFGAPILAAAARDAAWRARLGELPVRAIVARELRHALLRVTPRRARERFWDARYRLQSLRRSGDAERSAA